MARFTPQKNSSALQLLRTLKRTSTAIAFGLCVGATSAIISLTGSIENSFQKQVTHQGDTLRGLMNFENPVQKAGAYGKDGALSFSVDDRRRATPQEVIPDAIAPDISARQQLMNAVDQFEQTRREI